MTVMVLILAVLAFGVGYPLLALHYESPRHRGRRDVGGDGGGGGSWWVDGGLDGGCDGGGGDGGCD